MNRNYLVLFFSALLSLTSYGEEISESPVSQAAEEVATTEASAELIQIEKPDFIKKSVNFDGYVSLTTNYYTATNIEERRPGNVYNLDFSSELKAGRFFTMPINVMMSSLPVHFGDFSATKAISEFSIQDFIENPINTVQTGIHYKSFSLDLGTQWVEYSGLTMGNLPMFGSGITWNPGSFIFQANYGTAAHAIERDTTNYVDGQYRRLMRSFKLGLGDLERNYMTLNFIHGMDDTTSVSDIDTNITAESGVVVGLDWLFTFSKMVSWKGEVAGSIFTGNQKSEKLNLDDLGLSQLTALTDLFPYTLSTFADFAASTEFMQSYKYWSLGLKGEYVGAGFTSMGQPFLQEDRIDITASPALNLFGGKFTLGSEGGYRINNLSETNESTLTQVLMSGNFNAQLTKQLALSGSYSNFGIRNNVVGDTLRVQNITQSYSLIPTFTWEDSAGTNNINVSAVMNDFEDLNIVSGSLNSNASLVFSGGYNRTFKNIPLSLGASGSQFDLKSTLFEVHTTNVNLSAGYSFFDEALTLNLTGTYSINRDASPDADNQIAIRLDVSYETPFGMELNVSASNNEYNYAATSGLDFYRENLIDIGLKQSF